MSLYVERGKLSDNELTGVIYDLGIGSTVADCAERLGLTEKTVSRYYSALKKRISTDITISGPLTELPPKSRVVWKKAYQCIFECPARTLNHEAKAYLHKARETDRTTIKFGVEQSETTCSVCPFEKKFDVDDDLVHELFKYRAMHRGIAPENFREIYILSVHRIQHCRSWRTGSITMNTFVKKILLSLEKNKLRLDV